MLTALRKQAGSWVVKALLLLLVLSFAIWGIGDIFYGNPGEEAVAEVGSSEITSGELNNAFNRSLNNLQRQFGGQLTREQAVGIGLLQQALQEQIGQRLVDLEARDMGISVDDDTLRRLITENPTFQSAGRFDRLRFDQLLRTIGLSEEGYLETFRQELSRNALTGSVAAGATVPDVLVERIYRYRNEERRGRYIRIADADMTDLGTPDDAALEAIYQEDEQRFTAPEYRTITFITLEPKDLVDEVEVAEADIQTAYDDRSAQYIKPETRSVEQLLAPDQETADKAKSLVEEGKSFAEVADALKDDGVSMTDLGSVTEAGMPAGLGDDAFAVNEGEVTNPVKSPFGFHLFKITQVEPEEVTPFAEVRDEIKNQLALVAAEDNLPTLATQLDDELAAGGSVPDAAQALGLSAKTVTSVDRGGRDQAGAASADLPPWPALLQTAFSAPVSEPSLLEETDDGGYFVVQIDEIVEPRLKALDEVRDDVVAIWEEQRRRAGATEQAEEFLSKLQETASLETLAGDAGLTLEVIDPVKRADDGAASGINRAAVAALFETEAGKIAEEVIEVEDGVLVIANDEIIEKNPSDDQDVVEQLRVELERQVRADLLDQFGTALQQSHPVEINEAALGRLIENDGSQGYGGGGAPRPQPMF